MLFYIRKILSYITLFFIKGTLSDRDIKKLLGKHIFIYPFDERNLKPASYNLTASKCAFIKENDIQMLIVEGDYILIPAGKTAIIETEESIYVSKWISGTYHSRVRLVNRGLGHIGTTLDPCYFGISAIALHNTTQHDIPIKVGDSIATITFYALRSKSSGLHDNMTGRIDDNIRFDVNCFYNNYKCNENRDATTVVFKDEIAATVSIDNDFIKKKVEIIKNNKDVNDKAMIIYDLKNPVCQNCINCNNKELCAYKLLKNINDEKHRKKKIIEELKKWKEESWRVNKESLIKKVEDEIKIKNTNIDIFILSLITLVAGIGGIVFLLYLINKGVSEDMKEVLKIIIATIIPTVTLIIGMIVNYKKKYKGA